MDDKEVTRDEKGGVQVIARSAEILRALGRHPNGLSLGGIAKEIGLPRSTVQRIIAALEAESFVESAGPAGGMRLGNGLVALVSSIETDAVTSAKDALEQLATATGETVLLTQTIGLQPNYLFEIMSQHEVRAVPRHSLMERSHATAHGKIALSRMDDESVKAMLGNADLQRLSPHTIVAVEALLQDLDRVRRTGFAYDREEHGEGISAISVDATLGARRYEITIVVPAYRFQSNIQSYEAALLECKASVFKIHR